MKKVPTVTVPACSICAGPLYMGDPEWKGGNNAQPVNNGRCCDTCNSKVVIPMRLAERAGRILTPEEQRQLVLSVHIHRGSR